jgi:DUF3052 family protein
MPVGYSGKPLLEKLGIKVGARARFENAPRGYFKLLGPLPQGVVRVGSLKAPLHFVQFFVTSAGELRRLFAAAKKALRPDGMIWVSWPKRTSGVATDVDENLVRSAGLAAGLVDVKICAVDETWSGLKFVIRVRDRGQLR